MSQSSSNSSSNNQSIQKLQELLENILSIENESTNLEESLELSHKIIQEASRIIENTKSANEMLVDAKIIKSGTNFVNSNVSTLKTSLSSFDESKYVDGLLAHMEKSSEEQQSWECFAAATYHLFRKSHPVTYMLGTFTLEPPSPKEKAKVERQKRGVEAEKKILTSSNEKENGVEEESDVYKHIFKCLGRLYKKYQMKPVSYFHFIIDPNSYWRTVENIFHFAFLVRDGSVRMKILNGLPYVEPVLVDQESGRNNKKNSQFCLTLNIPQWKECIEKFKIQTPSIPPLISKTK